MKITRKQIVIAVITPAALGILAFAAIGIARSIFGQSLDFQMFEPGQLPTGLHITGHQIVVYKGETATFKRLVYTTNMHTVSLTEIKVRPYNTLLDEAQCKFAVSNQTCTMYHTATNQSYAIETTDSMNDPVRVANQAIFWQRGNTLFELELEGDEGLKYAPADWATAIDSFQPVQYHDPVKYEEFQRV